MSMEGGTALRHAKNSAFRYWYSCTPTVKFPELRFYLEGDPVPPKLFLAPAKDGGAPPDARGSGGAAAPSAASPSTLAGGRRMSTGKGGQREGCLHAKCTGVGPTSP
eukprot:COSAG01_NODE_433_length_17113_cov_23.009757_9_plen_107_part_00